LLLYTAGERDPLYTAEVPCGSGAQALHQAKATHTIVLPSSQHVATYLAASQQQAGSALLFQVGLPAPALMEACCCLLRTTCDRPWLAHTMYSTPSIR
jgi:hypothetical protein